MLNEKAIHYYVYIFVQFKNAYLKRYWRKCTKIGYSYLAQNLDKLTQNRASIYR